MFWFKSCPRCGGDLFSDSDMFGPYIACLQCSHEITGPEQALLSRPRAKAPRRRTTVVEREKVAA